MPKSKKPRVSVTKEADTGRNQQFVDNKTGETMSRAEFAKKIDKGEYPDYYTRNQGGLKTPVSKPDGEEGNNLG
jgi:hypothetical protein